jgi:hypothetical protein
MTWIGRLGYRLWWSWWKFRIGSDALLASGHVPPASRPARSTNKEADDGSGRRT